MKRRYGLLLAIGLSLVLAGCGSGDDTSGDGNKQTTTPSAQAQATTTQAQTTQKKEEATTMQQFNAIIETFEVKNGENTIHGTLYRPDDSLAHPAIIMCHGYNGVGDDFKNEATYYAKNGYVAYTFDFCGGSTRSKSTGASKDMTITSERSDLCAVFDTISALDCVDKNNIFTFGGSQGGFVTTLVTEEIKDSVRGMILYFPALCIPDNWRSNYPDPTKIPEAFDFWGLQLGKGFVEDVQAIDVFSSIGTFEGPVLIFHGDKDQIVPLSYSQKAVELYPNAELVVFTNEGHGFTPGTGQSAMKQVLTFMNKTITE